MRAFNYFTLKKEPRIGLDVDGKEYNFSFLWQLYKDIKGYQQLPDMMFLQVMVEMDYFSDENFNEVVKTVQEYRSMHDLTIKEKFKFDVPISRPQKIICIGKNYAAHAKEFQSTVPEEPMFFSKLQSALLPHGGQVVLPKGVGRVDHEVELAVIIGKTANRISEDSAMDYVAGYTIAVDVTARDVQRDAKEKGHPWTLAKGMDTFLPLGPYLIPADAVKDPHDLKIQLKVNSETRQKTNSGEMVFKIPKLISFISQYITLQPGDIICTGTPEGTLPLKDGDLMEATIEGFGVLKNSVVER
jgi:5-oxopent-3-ene-1,2,5-tricarboxylate decarboxylase / 2-hydroxyhepta-2,4-diene-1,7-dioate isomerase